MSFRRRPESRKLLENQELDTGIHRYDGIKQVR
jgi:hypothetical protein